MKVGPQTAAQVNRQPTHRTGRTEPRRGCPITLRSGFGSQIAKIIYWGSRRWVFHRLAYTDWGPIDAKRLICVHGLTRQGRDFDHLAHRLAAEGRRVICPNLPGRGRSGWISNPDHYSLPQYCADMNALIARLDASEVDWVGTSLGGLIGMAAPQRPVSRPCSI
ncbi:alpha/beta fold hydrolase (plasmid) [Bradyrhizobium sp. PMVTL-01]|uniref:alpha/beta fold hydrolase n=1 Tax=Bradyrhizobium sp. PMVTL-01 TaxID=3434999 RepID=UPI003F72FD05